MKTSKKNFCLICIKKIGIFHVESTILNDFTNLLLPYFQVVRTKVDSLFGKQLNNITKNPI